MYKSSQNSERDPKSHKGGAIISKGMLSVCLGWSFENNITLIYGPQKHWFIIDHRTSHLIHLLYWSMVPIQSIFGSMKVIQTSTQEFFRPTDSISNMVVINPMYLRTNIWFTLFYHIQKVYLVLSSSYIPQ